MHFNPNEVKALTDDQFETFASIYFNAPNWAEFLEEVTWLQREFARRNMV